MTALITLAAAADILAAGGYTCTAATLRRAARLGTMSATLYGKTWLTTREAALEWQRTAKHTTGKAKS